jgi:hypothetical protein
VQYAEADALDHLCLVPRMESGGYWETALTSFFGLIFSMGTQPWLVPTSIRRAYVGVGAFNMVRREAYEQFGGHGPIRLDVLDDVKLGKLVKRSGFRSNLLVAGDRLRVRWQPSAWGVIRGLEKNAFASQDYSVRKLVGSTLIFVTLFVLPYVGALAFDDARRWGFAAAALVAHFNYGWISSMFGGGRRGRFAATGGRKPALPDACGGWRVLPVLPLAALAILFAFWRSAVITLRQGGVRWRDTFYPLDLLRRNLYR